MAVSQAGRERTVSYEAVLADAEFRQVQRRLRRVVLPMVVGFLGWYFTYVCCAAFAPGFLAVRVTGEINVGLVLGVLQFVSTFALTSGYSWWARHRLDPATTRLRRRLEDGDLR
jgi:uncharacterized membrane protein (DUF485 family)